MGEDLDEDDLNEDENDQKDQNEKVEMIQPKQIGQNNNGIEDQNGASEEKVGAE